LSLTLKCRQTKPIERHELAERLLESLFEEVSGPEVEAAWKDEVRDRIERIKSGEAKLIPWEETERRLRERME
jgi:putative addiction module component (TIGR02574 family)